MTVTVPTNPSLTATAILFASEDDSIELLAESLNESAVARSLGTAFAGAAKAGRKVVAREVSAVAARLLSPEFTTLLLAAWGKHVALVEAGRRTFEAPGSREVVELLAHRVTSSHRPSVDLIIDGTRVATVSFELVLSFLVKGLTATVHSGELVQIHSGSCDVSATLAAEGVEIARGEGRFDLRLGVRLEQPFRLWPVAPEAIPIEA